MFLMGLDQINLCVGGNRGRGKVRVIVKLCPAILNLMWVLSKLDLIGSDSLITDHWSVWAFSGSFTVTDLRIKWQGGVNSHNTFIGTGHGCWRDWSHCEKKVFFFSVRFKFSFWIVCIYWSLYFVGDIFNIFELDTSLKPFHSEHKLLFYV